MLIKDRGLFKVVQLMQVFCAITACATVLAILLQINLQHTAFPPSLSSILLSINSGTASHLAQNSSRISTSSSTSSEKRQLLLVTMGRSGSSYTSALINKDSNVFFTFEPLHILDGFDLFEKIPQERAYGILKAFLLCDFTRIWYKDLNDNFLARTGNVARSFLGCARSKRYGFEHIKCFMDMVKHCQSKKYTFSKLIRLPMSMTERLLQEMPNLKILYLIRDPRAVIHSQAKVFQTFKWPVDVPRVSQTHCKRLINDTTEVTRLQRLFPGRIQVVRYENCVVNPAQYARDLYQFSGLEFTNETLDYIDYLHQPSKIERRYAFGIKRGNTQAVINSWRKSPGAYSAATFIDEACGKLYPKLGYLPVLSEQHV